MLKLPLQVKELVPGYRAKWRARYACFLAEIAALAPRLNYGVDGDTPWIELAGGPRLYGFATEPANEEVRQLLRDDLPAAIPARHFRIVKDCLNRYVYPHMRPDRKPAGYPSDAMFGFHGQHKDAVADLCDPVERDLFANTFMPAPDDVILDCGAFIGFGDLRVARDLPQGHIYAIEADRDCYALLERNIAENAVANVTPLHRAVWDTASELAFESDYAQANSLIREVQKGRERYTVRTITVDGAVEHFGLEKLDMLSLTLNGAEVEALRGADNALRSLRPRIRLAGWYTRDGRKVAAIASELLAPYGYRVAIGPRDNVMALPEIGR